MPDINDRQASVQTTVTSQGPMAAVVGFQSPYNEQRSVVALWRTARVGMRYSTAR